MELIIRRAAALPDGNGVLLGTDFIYQVAVSGLASNAMVRIIIEREQAFSAKMNTAAGIDRALLLFLIAALAEKDAA